jgi:hypothetical protein
VYEYNRKMKFKFYNNLYHNFNSYYVPFIAAYLDARFTCYYIVLLFVILCIQFFAYKMTMVSKNSMLRHRNVDLNTVSLKASDCTESNVRNINLKTHFV